MLNVVNARQSYSSHNEQTMIAGMLEKLAPVERFGVDIAALDGVALSNTVALYQRGWRGLAVEIDPAQFARLAKNYGGLPAVDLARCMVTPMNVAPLLQAFQTPRNFGFLSLDIDGYDYFVLEGLLAAYRPALIVTEINESIPPPIKFTVKFDPAYTYIGEHLFGQSISKLAELTARYKYDLVALEYSNAFLIPAEINPYPALEAGEAWRSGYLNRPDRKARFPWNSGIEPLFQMDTAAQLEYLQRWFGRFPGKYEIGL